MKQSIRQHGLALSVVIVAAAVVVACGQVTTSEEAQPAGGLRAVQPSRAKLVQADVCNDGEPCAPTGAHGKHDKYACTTCHRVGGRLAFDPAGPAYGTGTPAPSFDAGTKTCSSVACHGVPAGVYNYDVWDYGTESLEPRSVPYGGNAGPTPSWYATGLGCTACHNLTYGGITYSWHLSTHGRPFVTTGNRCETCHLDATGTLGATNWALSTATNCPPLAPTGTTECAKYHANGILNVTPVYRSGCSSCH